MDRKIIIKNIEKKQHPDTFEVIYSLVIRGNEYDLAYKISGEKIDDVPLFCDPIVVSLLVYAVKYGLSFHSDYPISEKLYYNLTKHLIPQMSVITKTTEDMIQINMPVTKATYHGKWVGTGLSLGVDSFATLHEYREECELKEYRLTHLVHLKTGAHHGQLGYFDQNKEDELFLAENNRVKKFCQDYGYKLIVIESNLFAVTCTEFGYGFDTTHTFRNLGCVLLLQNLFNKYYYASAFNIDEFELNLNGPSGHYEKWVLPYISTENMEFYSANTNLTRFQKTKFISQFDDTYDNLHVCWYAAKNCGHCKKCIRTLVTLDILGVLDKYSKSFDLEYYNKNREALVSEVVVTRKRDSFFKEIYNYMIESNYKIPSKSMLVKVSIKLLFRRIEEVGLLNSFKILRRKIAKKITSFKR